MSDAISPADEQGVRSGGAPTPLPACVDTVVLGAGVAGLAYAHGRGVGADVLVLEAGPRAGGLVRTEHARLPAEHGGGALHFEWGPEALQDNTPDVLALFAELGLAPLPAAEAARQRFVLCNGQLVALPTSPPAFLRSPLLSLGGKLRAFTEPWRDARTALDGSVADFVRHRLGVQVLDRLVDPFVTGIYAGDPELLSVRAAFPLLHALVSEHGSLLAGLRARGKAARARGEARRVPSLLSLPGGLSTLAESLAAALGPRLQTSVRVTTLRSESRGWNGAGDAASHATGEWVVESSAGTVRAHRVVCALPVRAAAKLLGPVSAALGEALGSMTCESVVSFVHCWRREDVRHPLDGFGYLVPGCERRLHLGTLFSSTIQPARTPSGTVLLRTLLGGARHARMVEWPDEELHATLADDVAPLLGLTGQPLYANIVRQRAVLPRYDLVQPARQERIEAQLAALPGLALVGNHRRGISVNALIETSRTLARAHAASPAA